MIIVELVCAIRDGEACDPEIVARIRADGREIDIDGPGRNEVDREQRVVSLRDGRTIACSDHAEDWARGLVVAYRTPYLLARVIADTNPPSDVEIEPTRVKEPVYR